MGFVTAYSACYVCGNLFTYNPMRVPSVPVNGVREPLCRACVERVNPGRVANGLPPIVPHRDAYTACNERDMVWTEEDVRRWWYRDEDER